MGKCTVTQKGFVPIIVVLATAAVILTTYVFVTVVNSEPNKPTSTDEPRIIDVNSFLTFDTDRSDDINNLQSSTTKAPPASGSGCSSWEAACRRTCLLHRGPRRDNPCRCRAGAARYRWAAHTLLGP